jgi:hypothetical protein
MKVYESVLIVAVCGLISSYFTGITPFEALAWLF